MSSYLSSWLPSWSGSSQSAEPKPVVPSIVTTEHATEETPNEEEEDDLPPAFPAIGSIQRSGGTNDSATTNPKGFDSKMMPPPPSLPGRAGGLSVSSSGPGGLALPPTTTKKPPNVNTKAKARNKVALAPGYGPLDWARLKSSGEDLRVSNRFCI